MPAMRKASWKFRSSWISAKASSAAAAAQVSAAAAAYPCPDLSGVWPALIYKGFSPENLRQLYALRQVILNMDLAAPYGELLQLALTGALRAATSAGAGWPYIAVNRHGQRAVVRDALAEFNKQGAAMIADIRQVQFEGIPPAAHRLIQGDARELDRHCAAESIDLIVTSPWPPATLRICCRYCGGLTPR